MKRDMDLIRKILFAIEELKEDFPSYVKIDGYPDDQVAYHCSLLYDAGFIKTYQDYSNEENADDFYVGSLTWKGADFLEEIKNDTVWNKAKETIVKKGLPMALDVIKSVVTSIVQGMVKGYLNQP